MHKCLQNKCKSIHFPLAGKTTFYLPQTLTAQGRAILRMAAIKKDYLATLSYSKPIQYPITVHFKLKISPCQLKNVTIFLEEF